METYERECCVRGYHVYEDTWEAAIGQGLECVREQSNAVDRYAVAVLKDDAIIGYWVGTCIIFSCLILFLGSSSACKLTKAHPESGIRCTSTCGRFRVWLHFTSQRGCLQTMRTLDMERRLPLVAICATWRADQVLYGSCTLGIYSDDVVFYPRFSLLASRNSAQYSGSIELCVLL